MITHLAQLLATSIHKATNWANFALHMSISMRNLKAYILCPYQLPQSGKTSALSNVIEEASKLLSSPAWIGEQIISHCSTKLRLRS